MHKVSAKILVATHLLKLSDSNKNKKWDWYTEINVVSLVTISEYKLPYKHVKIIRIAQANCEYH